MANGEFVSYLRVSTSKQGDSGLGLEAQRATVASYLNGGRWKIIAEFVEVESGRKGDRPVLGQALAACRLHRVPLIVAKVDRLTRSLAFLSRLLEAGVDVRFADLPQIEGATGRFMLQQMAAVAELEAGLIGERTKKALAEARKRGVKLGGNKGNLTACGERGRSAALQVRRAKAIRCATDVRPVIEALQATGATSLGAIAAGLTARRIPTARGCTTWAPAQVARLLAAMDGRP